MIFSVYRLTSPSSKSYIGTTRKSINDRFDEHIYLSSKDRGWALHDAIRKYGKENFSVELLCKFNNFNEASEFESKAIETYDTIKNGYNMISGYNIANKDMSEYISKKRKEFFLNEKNRDIASIERGGRSFFVYDIYTKTLVGNFISKPLCAEKLGLDVKGIINVFSGKAKVCGKYIFSYNENPVFPNIFTVIKDGVEIRKEYHMSNIVDFIKKNIDIDFTASILYGIFKNKNTKKKYCFEVIIS
jgi:hypothetical protein